MRSSRLITHLIFLLTASLLISCGGKAGNGNPINPVINTAQSTSTATSTSTTLQPETNFSLSFTQAKGFTFSWVDQPNATFYRLFENPDGSSGFSQVGSDIPQGNQTITITVPLYQRINASYLIQSCNNDGCTDSSVVSVNGILIDSIGYIKASNTDSGDSFGDVEEMSLSGDGTTLVVGASSEDGNATGVNGDQSNNSANNSGAAYVFTRMGNTWVQEAYLKASNAESNDHFGWSLSLSSDGNTLAVGAPDEDSNATGVNGDQSNNSANNSGAVYIFTRSGGTWSQQAYLKASNAQSNDYFGFPLNLSSDGNMLAVSAQGEDSNAIGVNGDQSDNSAIFSGAVYVFARSGGTWSQQAYLKASNTENFDFFSWSVSLSSNGSTLAVGAGSESSNATGVNGDQSNNSESDSGAVYIFTRSGSTWSQQTYLKASNTDSNDLFGTQVKLSSDGNTLAVGAWNEDSNATGVNGDQSDNSAGGSGAVYVFTRSSSTWSQQAYLKASNTDSNDSFGSSMSLSSDGNTLTVGALGEDSNATGVNGDQSNNSASDSGAVYLY